MSLETKLPSGGDFKGVPPKSPNDSGFNDSNLPRFCVVKILASKILGGSSQDL